MGADKKSLTKKCGEILLNLKTNKKSKVYTFNCAFCNANYDQLKKFSFHLDEKHSQHFCEEPSELSQQQPSPLLFGIEDEPQLKDEQFKEDEPTAGEDVKENLEMFVPDIKVEELMEIEQPAEENTGKVFNANNDNVGEDPLMMKESTGKRSTLTKLEVNVKREKDLEDSDDAENEDNAYDFNYEGDEDNDFKESVDGSASESSSSDEEDKKPLAQFKQERKTRKSHPSKKRCESDQDSDDSQDVDFDMEMHLGDEKQGKRKYRKSLPKPEINVDEKLLITTILQGLEQQPVLWHVKDRSQEKIIRQNAYETITMEVNEKLKIEMKWEDVRKRIQEVRNSYSRELEKQQKGEQIEIPWYEESIKFLKENIDVLVKHRYQKKKYRRLKTLDESHIPIIIEYYKNCEILWQVTNISFVVKPKKIDALKVIIQDLKEKHNLDISIHDMQRRLDYINRIYSVDRERELKCETDKSEFVPSSKFYTELSFLRDSQGPFKCSHCSEIIHKFETYHIHVGEHTNTIPFKCALCEMRFNKLTKYIVHAKRHLGVNNYHCDVCGKGYPFRAELDWHYREHTGEEPYLCEICGASFRSRHGYDNHIRRHENRFRYECHICKHGFNHLHALNAHVKAHLNIRDILCNVCGKGFTARKHLLRHQQIHSDEKKYKCLVCGKAFAQDAGLRAHRKQHVEYTSLAELAKKTEFRKGRYNYN